MKNILIVDQDPIMLQAFVGLLKNQGGFLNVLSAKNGKDAKEGYRRNSTWEANFKPSGCASE